VRTGIGVDAHRFAEGRRLFLGGEEILGAPGLAGHSDADVALHALADALLGACGAGDIGEMFPDTDPAHKDVSGVALLGKVAGVVGERGFRVVNADIVIICEAPRIAPYRAAMRSRIASALGIDTEDVSVKGTTTEGMGFTGRGEGIMAIATVLVD